MGRHRANRRGEPPGDAGSLRRTIEKRCDTQEFSSW
jgi:hypothetical protein